MAIVTAMRESGGLPFAGVDGCATGWLSVEIDHDRHWRVTLLKSTECLAHLVRQTHLTLIDMPIGLPVDGGPGQRDCDREARRRLGRPRSSSVFSVPSRAALTATTYPEALRLNREHVGLGISKQAWNILPRIRQIDNLLREQPDLQTKLRECHPEVCFWALNHRQAMTYNKKCVEGREERLQLLTHFLPQPRQILDYAMHRYRRREVASDDIIDAMVIAVTARLGHDRLTILPSEARHDAVGLAMEIVYADVFDE
jgi:predicted RNase H-like nuclease